MLVLDIQGTQSLDHRDRGVAGYVRETAVAIERLWPDAVAWYALNPDLLLPGGVEALVASGKLRFSDEIDWGVVDTLHVMSPYELGVSADRLLPAGFRGRVVVTLFDLISEVLADPYLADPGLRRRYRARHELVRHADRVLAISNAAKGDAVRILGVPERRIHVVPLAPGRRFVPAAAGGDNGDDGKWGGRREPFVLYTGGTDHRKNVERLLEAWGALPEAVRRAYDLVLACRVKPLERNHFEVVADRLGFRDRLHVTGWVTDDEMLRLTRRATLAVYPALYEGFGLPVAEALACHTPVIASNTSSLPELLPPEALFDPYDVADISQAIERALVDDAHRDALARFSREAPRRTYDDVARETLDALGEQGLPPRARATVRRTRRVAFASPLPPVAGGVSAYSRRLVDAFSQRFGGDVEVDLYVDSAPHDRGLALASGAKPLAALTRVEAVAGRYDAVVAAIGNSEHHTGALDLVHRRGGVTVLAHDVRLTTLHRFAAWQHPGAIAGGFGGALHRMYPGLPAELGDGGAITSAEAERWGVWMAREVIHASERFLVMSTFAAEVARLDAHAADRSKIDVVPFGVPPARATAPEADRIEGLVATFGVVNDLKRIDVLADAYEHLREQRPGTRLVFVGPAGDDEASRFRARGVEVTGAVDEETYAAWLARAEVAVQLRAATNGETSAATADCMAAGVATVVSDIGPARGLPDDAVVKVPADVGGGDLAVTLDLLLGDGDRRAALGANARAYAAQHTFSAAAEAVYESLFG